MNVKHAKFSVDAAVPKDAPANQPRVLLELLHDAVDTAERAVRRKRIATALPESHALIDRVDSST